MTKRTIKNYSLEFKQSSAKLAVESEQSITKTAQELGINKNTLHGWVKKYAPASNENNPTELNLKQELAQLKKENIKLKQERDILKKAAAYFASETQ
jgi:transposase